MALYYTWNEGFCAHNCAFRWLLNFFLILCAYGSPWAWKFGCPSRMQFGWQVSDLTIIRTQVCMDVWMIRKAYGKTRREIYWRARGVGAAPLTLSRDLWELWHESKARAECSGARLCQTHILDCSWIPCWIYLNLRPKPRVELCPGLNNNELNILRYKERS